MEITTVGQLRNIIQNLEDDYRIKFRICTKEIFQYIDCKLEFDDVGVSDRILILSADPHKKDN